jgi:WD40 repeat protein
MDHGDAQSTGRSKYPGPISGSVVWSIDTVSLNCGISLGEDESIYFSPNSEASKSGLYKVSNDGEVEWFYDTGNTISNMTTPMITSDGTIIACNGFGGTVFAINPNGTLKWKYEIGEWIQQRGINIGKDGTIYVIDIYRTLHAISLNGKLLWTLSLEDLGSYVTQGTSFSPDGKTLYTRGQFNALIAVDVNTKSIKWTFGDRKDSGLATPIVNTDGNIFFLGIPLESDGENSSLTALNSDGEVQWRYFFGGSKGVVSYYAPTIDKQGNIFFAYDSLYALNYLGELKWKQQIPCKCIGTLTCDVNDIVYIPVIPGSKMGQVIGYDTEGNLIWESDIMSGTPGESMALGVDYLVFPTHNSEGIYMTR